MKFQVEAEVMMGIERYRLQKDGSWKQIKSALSKNCPEFDREDSFSIGDYLADNLEETRTYVERKRTIELGGKVYSLNSQGDNFAKLITETIYIHPRVHRLTKPRCFSKIELTETIAGGDYEQANVLVLDFNGNFRLVDIFEKNKKLAPFAVRYESFIASKSYIGFRAARDKDFIARTYCSMLDGWTIHLKTGNLDIYQSLPAQEREAKLWRKVDYLTEHLK